MCARAFARIYRQPRDAMHALVGCTLNETRARTHTRTHAYDVYHHAKHMREWRGETTSADADDDDYYWYTIEAVVVVVVVCRSVVNDRRARSQIADRKSCCN